MTPFDRDDMYRLAAALDDICDFVDEAAANLVALGIETIQAPARAQAVVIEEASGKLLAAIERLEGFKVERHVLTELRELEDEGDRLAGAGISALFHDGGDVLSIIRWKDIYERLEEAVDAFHEGRIGFLDIVDTVREVLESHTAPDELTLDALAEAERWARERAQTVIAARAR